MRPLRDLRHAVRALAGSPTLLVVATLSLGLGVGVNTTLYSVFCTVFLRPPTAVAPERLVRIEPGNGNQIAYPNARDLVVGDAFEGLAAYGMIRLNLRTGGTSEQIAGLTVSPTFFDVLGARPAMGWNLVMAADSVVVTDGFWRRRLAARPDAIGAAVVLNGRPFTIAGVLPEGYRAITGAIGPDVYVGLSEALTPALADRRHAFLTLIARLRPGVSFERARAETTSQARPLERLYPVENAGFGRPPFVFPVAGLASWQTRDVGTTAIAGIAAVPFALAGLVLLIACANVAGLLLARGAARRREIAIRLALGASRGQVVMTLLAESVLLSLSGSVAGLLFAFWMCRAVSAAPLPSAHMPLHVVPDLSALGYALCLACLVALACGVLPALASTRSRLTDAIGRDSVPRLRRVTIRRVLVSGQVAVATVLLFMSALLLRSVSFIRDVDPGFSIDDAVTASIEVDPARFSGAERLRVVTEATDAVRAIPGVVSAAMASLIPLGGDMVSTSFEVEHAPAFRRETYVMNVGPGYFQTMNIQVRRGRDFAIEDRAGAPARAVVNQAFVVSHGLAANPLGARVRANDREPWLEIVGVVDDSNYAFFGEAPHPILYKAFAQTGGRLFVVARVSGAPVHRVPVIREVLAKLEPNAMVDVRAMRDATSLEPSLRRAGTWLLGGLGGLGLGLALIGLYGLMSSAVTERTREIGVRIALGASRRQVQALVLGDAAMLVGIGAALGTALAIAITRPMAFLLSGVHGTDPWAIVGTAALFLGAGLAAAHVPARRATGVDPMIALRCE